MLSLKAFASFYHYYLINYSTDPIKSNPIRKIGLNCIFIFETFNHVLTEITINTNDKQGISEKAGHKSVDSL